MSKTQFSNGSNLSSTYLNTIYGSGPASGHVHDGVDSDGHVSQVNLQSHVAGILPPIHYGPPADWINGGNMTWSNSGSAYSITFDACSTSDTSYGFPMLSSNSMTKQVISSSGTAVVTWSPGSGAGGVASGATLPAAGHSGWLHAFAICNGTSTYTPDFGFDSSLTAVNLKAASGYNRVRRIGSIYISNAVGTLSVYRFLQYGDRFSWGSGQLNSLNPLHTAAGGSGLATLSVPIYTCPPDVVTTAILQVISQAAAGESIMTSWTSFATGSGNVTTAYANADTWCTGSATGNPVSQAVRIEVDTSGGAYLSNFVYCYYAITGSSASTYVSYAPWGYIDRRGKDNQ